MFSGGSAAVGAGEVLPAAPGIEDLRDALDRLAVHDGAGLSEAGLVDHLRVMEQLKSGLAVAQARVTARLAAERSRRESGEGVPAGRRCRGLGAEVGLARQESPVRGAQHLGLAQVLVHELPHTLAALTRGEISEWRATLVARETAVLTREHRARVDAELAGQLTGAGDRRVAARAREIGYRLDPGSAIRRVRGAHSDRHVGLRPAPDTMTYLTGFLPVAQGIACKAALEREADRARSQGDTRTRGQIMADTLVQRVTGQTTAEAVPVEINLVMTDASLFGPDHTPARLHGHGPIPAHLARRLVRDADKAWIRRLYTRPGEGQLVAMETRKRRFDGPLRQFLLLRDQTCRNPWCDAPARHLDHITRAVDGGPTSAENGQALCEACNYAKEAAGWHTRRLPGHQHLVETTTPTGHHHNSRAPDPPGHPAYPVRIDLLFAHAA